MATTVRLDIDKASGKELPWHNQRVNTIRPFATCADSSSAMALRYSGWGEKMDKFIPQSMHDADYITNFIQTDQRVLDFWKNYPEQWIKDLYAGFVKWQQGKQTDKETTFGNEIGVILEFAINTMMKERVESYSYSNNIKNILWNLLQGGAVVVGGKFPSIWGTIGHIVCLTGFTISQDNITKAEDFDLTKLMEINFDDPFGDYHTLYNDGKGNNMTFTLDEFQTIITEITNKTVKIGHLYKKCPA